LISANFRPEFAISFVIRHSDFSSFGLSHSGLFSSRSSVSTDSSRDLLPTASIHRGNAEELLWWLICGYLLLILGCSGWLHAESVMAGGQSLNYDRALFLSVSTATLSGFQLTIGPNDFQGMQGPIILIILTLAGSLMTLIVAGLAAARVLRLSQSDRQIIVGAMTVELLAVLAGTAVLYTGHADFIDALLQSACAFGNSGAVITAKSAGQLNAHSRFPAIASWQAQCVLLPLSIVGGLGLPVVMEVYDRLLGQTRRLSLHSRTVLRLTAGVYVLGTLLLFLTSMFHHGPGTDGPRFAFLASTTTALNARSAGLPFDVLNVFSRPGQWLIVILMMIGASPAGTAGGLKATTFWHLYMGIRNVLTGRPVSRVFGIAAVWLAGYCAFAGIGFLLLSSAAPQLVADQAAFLTISALSNVGLSHDPVSLVGWGLFVLDFIMLVGRLSPLVILWWMAVSTKDVEVLVA
jgi:Trk-type K+ transport system membrane component